MRKNSPISRVQHQLVQISNLIDKYPSKIDLALASTPKIGKSSPDPNRLPFNADKWLDNPSEGIYGANSKTAIIFCLTSWLETWKELIEPTHDPFTDLSLLAAALADFSEDEFDEFAREVEFAYLRVRSVVAAPVYGPFCPVCECKTIMGQGVQGWDGVYFCVECDRRWSPDVLEETTLERVRNSAIWLNATDIGILWPEVTASRLRKWVFQGKLHCLKNHIARNLYRPKDVRKLLKRD